MKRSMLRVVALVVLAGAIAACDLVQLMQPVPPSPRPLPPPAGEVADTAWTVMSLDAGAVPPDAGIEMAFTATEVKGNSGCNSFGGPYRRDGASLTFGAIVTTERACEAPVGDRERALYQALPEIRTYQVFRGDLLLLDAAGRTRIQLRQGVGIGG